MTDRSEVLQAGNPAAILRREFVSEVARRNGNAARFKGCFRRVRLSPVIFPVQPVDARPVGHILYDNQQGAL